MEIQNISVFITNDGKLEISWLTMIKAETIQVSIANDSIFTKNPQNFLLPADARCCLLDIGKGGWFLRIGAWVGTVHNGTVKWSGVVGPFQIQSEKEAIKDKPSKFLIKRVKPIENGLRMYTRNLNPNYVYAEVSLDPEFDCTKTRYDYIYDWGMGYVDITNLLNVNTYYIRYSSFSGYPTNTMIHLPKGNVESNVKSLVSLNKYESNKDRLQNSTELLLLKEIKEKPNMRFASHADYIRYMVAKNTR